MKTVSVGALAALLVVPSFVSAAPADDLIDAYLAVQAALATDTLDGVSGAAARLEKAATALKSKDAAITGKVGTDAKALCAAKDLVAARAAFKDVSTSVVALVANGYAGKRTLASFYCSMAKGSWVQEGEAVRNPYYGKSMLKCGTRLP